MTHATKSSRTCGTSVCVILAVVAAYSTSAVSAQEPKKPADPETAKWMIAKAESFLQRVAASSPLQDGMDADRAQAWPRSPTRIQRLPNGEITYTSERILNPTVAGHEYSNALRNGGLWSVKFYGGEIEVTLTASGEVRSLLDFALSNSLLRDPPPERDRSLSQEDALARTEVYLRAAGIPVEDLRLNYVEYVDQNRPPSAYSRKWNVRLDRTWNGVPFHDQYVSLALDAALGRLLNFGATLAFATPASTRIDVPAWRAAEIARNAMIAWGATLLEPPVVKLQIAPPNNYARPGDSGELYTDSATRLVWFVRGKYAFQNSRVIKEVHWVDALTGEIIGGVSHGAPRGKHIVTPEMKIIQQLGTAVKLKVFQLTKRGGSAVIIESASSGPAYYGALSDILPQQKKAEKPNPTHRLIAIQPKSSHVEMDFDSTNGSLIDQEGNIAIAGKTLRTLLAGRSPTRHR